MSVAWTTIAVIVLLLPGIFFFIGLATYERFSREIIRSGVVSEVALATMIAIVLHTIIIILMSAFGGFRLSQFAAPFLDYTKTPAIEIGNRAAAVAFKIVAYVVVTAFVGFLAGMLVAKGVVAGPLRRLAMHKWIYDIIDVGNKGGIVTAFIMTNIIENDRALMYKGRVQEIFLNTDGNVSYIIIKNCTRYYMMLGGDKPTTSTQLELFGAHQAGRSANVWDYLLIDGSKIANVLFDPSPEITADKEGEKLLDKELLEAFARLTASAAAIRSTAADSPSTQKPRSA
ncbi:MAG: hypothetical protein JWN71_1667 [Xanthobacteraceae bacterium]|nr:hypothetical protein [Xanthobacteraceae bacterium]